LTSRMSICISVANEFAVIHQHRARKTPPMVTREQVIFPAHVGLTTTGDMLALPEDRHV
jgi:hypothetical protein